MRAGSVQPAIAKVTTSLMHRTSDRRVLNRSLPSASGVHLHRRLSAFGCESASRTRTISFSKKKKKERKKRTSTTVLGVPFPGEMEKLVFGDGNETQNNDEIERMAARVDE